MAITVYAGLDVSARSVVFTRARRRFWLVATSVVCGTGLWSAHLTWILGSRLPVQVNFDLALTVLSWAAAVAVALLGMSMIQRRSIDSGSLALGGAVIGVGLCVLHYAGMFALRTTPRISYDSELFSTSVFLAMGASAASLSGGFAVQHYERPGIPGTSIKLAAALMIAAAMSGVFHVATVAANFSADAASAPDNLLRGERVALAGMVTALVLTALVMLLSAIDAQLVKYNRRLARERDKALFGSIAGG
jgi:NO-binding membrane sensor protein with MHYT domain